MKYSIYLHIVNNIEYFDYIHVLSAPDLFKKTFYKTFFFV